MVSIMMIVIIRMILEGEESLWRRKINTEAHLEECNNEESGMLSFIIKQTRKGRYQLRLRSN